MAIVVLLALGIVVPFSPSIIAAARTHARTGTIFAINIVISVVLGIPIMMFSGGFGILVLFPFWAWILVWAIMGEKRKLPDYTQLAAGQAMARKWKQLKA